MSLLRTLDQTSTVSNGNHACSMRSLRSFLYPVVHARSRRHFIIKPNMISSCLTTDRVGIFFVKALANVSLCSQYARHLSTSSRFRTAPPGSRKMAKANQPQQATKTAIDREQPSNGDSRRHVRGRFKQFAEKELRALVDYYGIEFDARPEADPEDDGKLVWNVGSLHTPWPLRDQNDAAHVESLIKLLRDEESSHDLVFDAYSKLPSPGVVYLESTTIRALLHHLSVLERPTVIAMRRFLSILDDMKTAHIHIIRSEWTTAIHLAGRAMGAVSADRMQSALHIWHDMEHRAGVRGGFVTLNVLFHIAVMGGKFTLAETFLKEMQARQLRIHRHHRVSKIYYYGVLQDGNAVRRTYQELVASGDIVDTTVMNAVMAALIRAGEPSAAEHVFERMKRLHATKAAPAPGHKFFTRTWRQRRSLGLLLTHEALQLRGAGEDEKLKELQDYAPIAPDSRTYALLIRHQSTTVGNFERVQELLREMHHNSVPLEGTIFIVIFHGFNSFGGMRYTSWTRDKLEGIWSQYLLALSQELDRVWLSSLAIVAALRAFRKVTDPERTLRAWQDLRLLWHPDQAELENVLRALRTLLPMHAHTGFSDGNHIDGV